MTPHAIALRFAVVVTLLVVCSAASAAAGPWALGKGKLYAKLGYGHLRSQTLVTPDGSELRIPTFTKNDVALYAAYGLSTRVTATASLLWLNPAVKETGFSESGISDTRLGLEVQLGRRGPWVFGASGHVQAPTGDETKGEGVLPTGSGVWEGEASLAVGRSLSRGKGYGRLEAGHWLRASGLRDALTYGMQVGWHVGSRVTLAGNVRGVEPYDTSQTIARGSPVGLSDRVTWAIVGPTVFVKLAKRTTLQADVDVPIRARNLAEGPTFRVGLAWTSR